MRRRRTINFQDQGKYYSQFRSVGEEAKGKSKGVLEVEFSADQFSVGKEVVFGRLLTTARDIEAGSVCVFEFYRFDDDCHERITFDGDVVIFGKNTRMKLFARFSSITGFERYVEEEFEMSEIGDGTLYMNPMNIDWDVETGLCAANHRRALERVAGNRDMLKCVHCGRPVSEALTSMVEFGAGKELMVGLVHSDCIRPADRRIGRAKVPFFEENPGLVKFDVNAWFAAAHAGNVLFRSFPAVEQKVVPVFWNRRTWTDERTGGFVIDTVLSNGSKIPVTKRGRIQRFSKHHVHEAVKYFNRQVAECREKGNPLCMTDRNYVFGVRSSLMDNLERGEVINEIAEFKDRPYESIEEAQYSGLRNWYAPLLALIDSMTHQAIVLGDVAPVLSDPLKTDVYLSNWRECGFDVRGYETVSLLTDDEVDEYFSRVIDSGLTVIVDPFCSVDGSGELMQGFVIQEAAPPPYASPLM